MSALSVQIWQNKIPITIGQDFAGGVISRGLYVGVAGDVEIHYPDGTAELFPAVPAGTFLPVACIRVTANSAGVASDYRAGY